MVMADDVSSWDDDSTEFIPFRRSMASVSIRGKAVNMLIVAAILALLVGLMLGLLGGGGAILTTPMLIYLVGLEPKEAITASLVVVGVTSAISAGFHTRLGNVDFRTGAIFGGAGMTGAFVGGRLAGYVSATVLLLAFAAMMLVTAIMMLKGRGESAGDGRMHAAKAMAVGAVVGFIAGLVGAGGGFLIVPALVLFGNIPMRRAIGTSLFVITLQSIAGFAGHIAHARVPLSVVAPITAMTVIGTIVGVRYAQRVSTTALRRAFAWFVLAMGIFVLAKQVSWPVTLLFAGVALSVAFWVSRASAREPQPGASGTNSTSALNVPCPTNQRPVRG